MKNYFKLGLLILAVSLYSCGGGEGETEGQKEEKALVNPNNPNNPNNTASSESNEEEAAEEEIPASQRVDLENKGVGPVTDVTIPETIDEELAAKGQEVYEKNCTACHKPDKKHIGPAPKDILERRTPEWVMNMIINPDKMVQEDPLAKDLLIEFNGSPMSNQGITEDEARAILEYIRTL
ncbi:cytochrome C [Brumimicrobium salinarum]|uniref:Cytochrome C n=1 Tax=Brumimicrobium salinarum TaxID=2058658 RepID=A0A2I0R3H1_9FLAO|nr:cytochrome c [Brumimicrobium salinarum]PKR81121.1 cytochrome C [Brumimicrobium salinarum]